MIVRYRKQFKKDYNLMMRRGLDISAPDWLLVYEYETLEDGEEQLVCIRTGSHADLFRK